MIDAIIFDGEGVVVDTEPLWDEAQEQFLRRRGRRYDRKRIKPLLTGKSLADGTAVLMRLYGLEGDVGMLSRERLGLVLELVRHKIRYVKGFQDFFEKIRYTHKNCLATSMANELLQAVKQRLNLSQLFDERIYTLEDVGYRSKPDPDLFLYAAKQLSSKPSSCVVIEDSPLGIRAASRAGMKCYALTTTYSKNELKEADVIVRSFDEIRLDGQF